MSPQLTLHSLTCYEELVTFLQQSIHQVWTMVYFGGMCVFKLLSLETLLDIGSCLVSWLVGWVLQHPICWRSVYPLLAVRWGVQGLNSAGCHGDSEKGCSLSRFVSEGLEVSMAKNMISGAFSLCLNLGFTP